MSPTGKTQGLRKIFLAGQKLRTRYQGVCKIQPTICQDFSLGALATITEHPLGLAQLLWPNSTAKRLYSLF